MLAKKSSASSCLAASSSRLAGHTTLIGTPAPAVLPETDYATWFPAEAPTDPYSTTVWKAVLQFVSATGTLLAPFLASHAPNRFKMVATMGALMTFTHIAKLAAFGFIGFAIGSYLPLMAAMIAVGAVGNWLGERALMKMSEQRFRLVLQIVLTLLALRLIWSAGVHAGLY